ncbi:MAG: YdeI/OmpD-associated family protein [Pyrinomonadaceae bacterium]
MDTVPNAKFNSTVEITDSDPPWHILRVEKSLVTDFGFKGNLRRVICSLNGGGPFNCSLFPSKGDYFLTLGKQMRKALGVEVGDNVSVELSKDMSKYGMPMPEEFAEVLRQDKDGEQLFNALSPGDQRLMLKLVVFVKDPDRRIVRGLTGIELLKRSDGKFVYSEQHLAMRLVAGSNIRFERQRPD